jgi:putative nucleotidyltransferase with HDIG domain
LRFLFSAPTLDHLLPARPEVLSHCDRVAALACAIARVLGLPAQSVELLKQAARLHHVSPLALHEGARNRLLADLLASGCRVAQAKRRGFWARSTAELAAVLGAFQGVSISQDGKIRLLVEVLFVSDVLDDQFQPPVLEPLATPEIWRGLDELRGIISSRVLDAAHRALGSPFPLPAGMRWELSAQALVAKEVLCTLAANPECDVPVLSRLAGRDPVMAGKLIESANSALHSRQGVVASIQQAISYIGTQAARKVLLALALQRLWTSSHLAQLWRHSVGMAQYCETLARDHSLGKPDEALLAALVHDIGRMALETLPARVSEAHARLVEDGCPPAYAEDLLLGCDHAEIGAQVLRSWRFPDHLIEAVRFHHRPADSDSQLASALYLAEFWAETDEEVPRRRHWDAAVARTRLSLEELARNQYRDQSLGRVLSVA